MTLNVAHTYLFMVTFYSKQDVSFFVHYQ